MVQVQTAIDTIEIVSLLGNIFNRDVAHSLRVTEFSLVIFDELSLLHGYGSRERQLLEIAAILHDIGYSQPDQKPHNKTSRDLILAMNIPGVSELDKLTFALIARYHTGDIPDINQHEDFAELPDERKEMVEWLSGILRIADALDAKHIEAVKTLEIDLNDRQITFFLDVEEDCRKQIKRAHEKEDLLIKKSNRMIKYRCL